MDNLLIIFLIKKSIDSLIFNPVLAEVLKLAVKLLALANPFKLAVFFLSLSGSKSALFSIKIIGKGLPSLNTSTSSTACFHFKALKIKKY